MKKIIFIIIYLHILTIQAQSIIPKREFRGAWVATVVNLGWPSSRNLSVEKQKQELIQLFDKLAETNINVIIFQIRTECDAFYQSPYEPWSYWLTGTQGLPPQPFYDPLKFAIEEAHKRGMELHAWFNPYRAVRNIDNYIPSNNHVTQLHPEWILTFNKINIKILNPGLTEVRKYVKDIVMDVVERYDIDGVHFDDYFYPYPDSDKDFSGITNEDAETFSAYPRGFTNIDDWRRDNVNELIRMVYNAIQNVKPYVKFGVSPFGIWKNGVPSGIVGLDAYNKIYCDPVTWLNEQNVDYIAPQLYWPFGGEQDYGKLLPWWASKTNGRFLFAGQALYRAKDWNSNEIPEQIQLNRNVDNCFGNILFRASNFYANSKGVVDSLKNKYFKFKAIPPVMNWKDEVPPNVPNNLRYESLPNIRGDLLVWDKPAQTSDGDTATSYVIYRFDNSSIELNDLENPENIFHIGKYNYKMLSNRDVVSDKMYFTVTALDHNKNESLNSNIFFVEILQPEIPLIIAPNNEGEYQRDSVLLVWNNSAHSNYNKLQLSLTQTFDSIAYQVNNISDTFKVVTNLEGRQTYYWRVSAGNQIGESDFSEPNMFFTGFPKVVNLISPNDKLMDVDIQPQFNWNASSTAIKYHFQLAEGLTVEPSITIMDTVITDTVLVPFELKGAKIYSWRVRAGNEYGYSNWSTTYKFRTKNIVTVETTNGLLTEFRLEQNYPNPFNPVTTIQYSIPVGANNESPLQQHVLLKVYDILGKEVATLVNRKQKPGNYKIQFDASNLSSGVYFYVLRYGNKIKSNKMILSK